MVGLIPELDVIRLKRWIDHRHGSLPPKVRDHVRYDLELEDPAVTMIEHRPPFFGRSDAEWNRFPIARFRYTTTNNQWSLFWRDPYLKFHRYDAVEPTPFIDNLIEALESDTAGVFWG